MKVGHQGPLRQTTNETKNGAQFNSIFIWRLLFVVLMCMSIRLSKGISTRLRRGPRGAARAGPRVLKVSAHVHLYYVPPIFHNENDTSRNVVLTLCFCTV